MGGGWGREVTKELFDTDWLHHGPVLNLHNQARRSDLDLAEQHSSDEDSFFREQRDKSLKRRHIKSQKSLSPKSPNGSLCFPRIF